MKLYHWSPSTCWTLDPARTYKQDDGENGHFKPKGLWLSAPEGDDSDGWAEWVIAEEYYGIEDGGIVSHFRYEVEVDASRLLTLNHPSEMDPWFPTDSKHKFGPPWNYVALHYPGVVVPAYARHWEATTGSGNHSWWYGWDCSSACIWDMSVIEGVTACE